jgi:hypothetical protein
MNNVFQFIQQVQQFRQNMQGQNPDQIIQNMMQNGKLSQSQYEQARQRAEQIQRMMSPGAQG